MAAGAAVVTLSAISTVGIAAATGGLSRSRVTSVWAGCVVPPLPGAVVTVTLSDIRSKMGAGSMMGGSGSMMSQNDWPRFRHGMMTVTAAPASVAAGTVSLRVNNAGYLTHELVVLPLAASQPGQRVAGNDGKVSETGSAGEASATCAAGAGEGITAGSVGWVNLTLTPGRYELVCNLAGHYGAGMYTELDVQ